MAAKSSKMKQFLIIFAAYSFILYAEAKQVAMKVVEEPSNYGMNFGGYQEQNNAETEKLVMRVTPSNFSGPAHLRCLIGKCFNKIDDSYKYEFCPFSNVSQHEQSLRWNPYSGILGVWQEWDIENNTFVGMVMQNGDRCGSQFRSVKVTFKCAEENVVEEVTEPNTCHYNLKFATPLVCHKHSMLVYPNLPEKLRHEWDLIETELSNEEITNQGYKKALRKLFEKAGYQMSTALKETMLKKAGEKLKAAENVKNGDFSSLTECHDEYMKLKNEVNRLKGILEQNNIQHNENKALHDLNGNGQRLRDDQFEDYEHYGHDMDSMEL